ncbi:MAG: hypothetical protein P4L64_01705 [Caulobacteraceae bacterium]|nr:hypothetical protein [Caulobacteraceae bacterium]
MKKIGLGVIVALLSAPMVEARASDLKGPLEDVSFLAGEWNGARGQVFDTGGTSTGRSSFTAEVGGMVLLRRDHTDLFDKVGKPQGGFDQMMWIYPEGNALRADYSDGQHVIHYVRTQVTPGHSVMFMSEAQPGAPTFRLTYTLTAPDALTVSFDMAPPGQAEFHSVAQGELQRSPR